jgi:integrase
MTPETDPRKALAWARRAKPRLLAGNERKILIRDLASGFFDEGGAWYKNRRGKGRDMTGKSLTDRQAHLVNYIIPLFGDYDIRELSGSIIDAKILEAERFTAREGLDTATSKKPLTKATRSKLLYSIKLMYDSWIVDGLVQYNPTAAIIKYSKEPERPRSPLPDDVCDKLFPPSHFGLIKVWGSSMWASFFAVLMDTGARPGEIRATKWKDYHPEDRYLPIRKAIESGTKDKIKTTKNKKVKPAYLSERTAQELAIWRAESRASGDNDYIWTVKLTTPLSDAAIGQAFARTLEREGFDSTNWTPYYLRHTFATFAMTVLTKDEMEMVFGDTTEVMRKHYIHETDENMRIRSDGAKKKLDEARRKKKK